MAQWLTNPTRNHEKIQCLHLLYVFFFFSFLDSGVVSDVVLQDLLAYVSSKHSYLRDLPQRQPQKMSSIEFVELEQLQPDILVHAVLRVVDISIFTGIHCGLLLNFRLKKN